MKTLYEQPHHPIDTIRYIAVAREYSEFKKWCHRFHLDYDSILFTKAKEVTEEALVAVKQMDDLRLILFTGWNREGVSIEFIENIYSKAAVTHLTPFCHPVVKLGYIINWKVQE